MKRLASFLILICLSVVVATPLISQSQTKWERQSARLSEIAKDIQWMSHEPLIFHLRRGTMPENRQEIYNRMHDPENVKKMAEVGALYGRPHFWKGLGLNTEWDEIRNTVELAKVMHKYDMKVSLYVGGTMFTETFYREVPEAINWEARDQWNQPINYSGLTQTYRHFPCINVKEYRDYMKKVLDVGIDSVKTDQFFFDNFFLRQEPCSDRHPNTIAAFKVWLKNKYPTKDAALKRFGYPDTDWIELNEWGRLNRAEDVQSVDDPVLQEWVRFRCENLAEYCGDFYDYIKNKKPTISVGYNLKGLYSSNRIWFNAVYHPLFSGKCDFFPFDIAGMDSRIDSETGALVTEIRSYKMARVLDMSCSHGGRGVELAEQMTFNNQKYVDGFGYVGAAYNHYTERNLEPLAMFFRNYNDRFYTDTDNVTDVAILRGWASMAYSVTGTWLPATLMEQVLIQHKIPFNIIFDEQLGQLDRYQCIVLPEQESLSDGCIDTLLTFVKNGGTLVFTGNTADYNDWRERRKSNPLIAFFDGRKPVNIVRKVLGKGKLVYIPEIIPSTPMATLGGLNVDSKSWTLPVNHQAIALAINYNLPQGQSLDTGAPLTTLAEFYRRDKTRENILHFVNYDYTNRLAPFEVSIRKQFGGEVKKVQYYSVEFDDPQTLDFKEQGNMVIFKVPESGIYSMIVVSQ